jgi:hypothetical protein
VAIADSDIWGRRRDEPQRHPRDTRRAL